MKPPSDRRGSERIIDLSADLGEAADERGMHDEAALWPMLTSASVACGGHAGDDNTMRRAADRARRFGVVLGAHPSYPDRRNFGRVSIEIRPETLVDSIVGQIASLERIAAAKGVKLRRVKAHGALYNDAARDERLAALLVRAVAQASGDLALVCGAESVMWHEAQSRGLRTIAEAFGDRRYAIDGSLVSRGRAGALLTDAREAAAQAREIVINGRVTADDGSSIPIIAETLCIHSDMQGAAERLTMIRSTLSSDGVTFAARESGWG